MWKWLADHKVPMIAGIRQFFCESVAGNACYHFLEPRKLTLPPKHGSYFPSKEECKIVKIVQCCHCGRIKDYDDFRDGYKLADKKPSFLYGSTP